MAVRKNKSIIEQALDVCKQLSLYVKNDVYESIMSDYHYFFGIDDSNMNEFLNTLLKALIEHSIYKKNNFFVKDTEIFSDEKKEYRSGKILRLRITKPLRCTLYDIEKVPNTLVSDGEEKMSLAENSKNSSGEIDDKYYISLLKKYCDLLLNKYGSMSKDIREGIYFREKYNVINECIKRHKLLIINSDGSEYTVRPYNLTVDASVGYLYLTGFVDKPEKAITSFRFSRTEIISSDFADNSGKLKAKEKEKIKKRLAETGAAYLRGEIPKGGIEVLMTEEGYRLYSDVIIHQRPGISEQRNGHKYIEYLNDKETAHLKALTGYRYTRRIHFSCTPFQALFYFSRFGCEAVVTNPTDLAKQCCDFALKAAEAYSAILDKNDAR